MASGTAPVGAVVRQIGRLFGRGTAAGLGEAELLARYARDGDDAAFESLVRRYGPMVLGVCRQLLRDPNDADDAFQATFLVLARRARSIRDGDLLGNWLYGVARRIALRARADAARRRLREPTEEGAMTSAVAGHPRDDDARLGDDERALLHDEIGRLPDRYRVPIVLCHLDGLPLEEAARRIGCPLGTVKGRLARARALLGTKLARRGLALPAVAVLVTGLDRPAAAALPEPLLDLTVRAARALAAGSATTAAAGTTSAAALRWAHRELSAMLATKFTLAGATLALGGLLASGGAGALATQEPAVGGGGSAGGPPPIAASGEGGISGGASGAPAEGPLSAPEGGADAGAIGGDGEGAETSIENLLAARLEAARKALEASQAFFEAGTTTQDRVIRASAALADAEADATNDQVTARQAHLIRMGRMVEAARNRLRVGSGSADQAAEAEAARAEAELALARARLAGQPGAMGSGGMMSRGMGMAAGGPGGGMPGMMGGRGMAAGGTSGMMAGAGAGGEGGSSMGMAGGGDAGMGGRGGMAMGMMGSGGGVGGPVEGAEPYQPDGQDPRSAKITAQLDRVVAIPFTQETPLRDVFTYLSESTKGPDLPNGLPIYVDPVGLAETEVTHDAPISLVMPLEGVPLRTSLKLLLRQVGLAYAIDDGLLIISSPDGLADILQEGPKFDADAYRARKSQQEAAEAAAAAASPGGTVGGFR